MEKAEVGASHQCRHVGVMVVGMRTTERSNANDRAGCEEVKRRTFLELVGLYSQWSYVWSGQGRWKGKSGRMKSESNGIHYA